MLSTCPHTQRTNLMRECQYLDHLIPRGAESLEKLTGAQLSPVEPNVHHRLQNIRPDYHILGKLN